MPKKATTKTAPAKKKEAVSDPQLSPDQAEDLLAGLAQLNTILKDISTLKTELPKIVSDSVDTRSVQIEGYVNGKLSEVSSSLNHVQKQAKKMHVWSFKNTCIMILLSLTLAFGGGIVGSFLMVKAHPDFFLEAIFKMSTNKFLDKLGQLYKKA